MDIVRAKHLLSSLKERDVTLVAVSKTKPASDIEALYNEGFRIFGENRVQELVEKHEALPKDIQWHMIGNLQKNKVKHIAPFIDLIHSVSSASLLEKINQEGAKNERQIPVLLQLKIASEDSKSGMDKEDLLELVQHVAEDQLPHVQLKGLMGMATFTDDQDQIREEFRRLSACIEEIDHNVFNLEDEESPILSFGMSGDYELAIEEGSTMVRIGSLIFGSRN